MTLTLTFYLYIFVSCEMKAWLDPCGLGSSSEMDISQTPLLTGSAVQTIIRAIEHGTMRVYWAIACQVDMQATLSVYQSGLTCSKCLS